MKFIERMLAKTIIRAAKTFPAVTITGPRQSGKTTFKNGEEFQDSKKYRSKGDNFYH